MRRQQPFQLADRDRVLTEPELGVPQVLHRGQAHLVEPADLGGCPTGRLGILQRRATPKGKSGKEMGDGIGSRGFGEGSTALCHLLLEADHVNLIGPQLQEVP